jgi:ABC-2 type transport system ATP-binding protein
MITIQSLTKSYNNRDVVSIDSLTIEAHQCFGLVGNNGAGKTTLFRLILDLIQADSGTVTSFDHPVAQNDRWKQFTASFLDETFLIPFLSPEEYFSFVGKAYNISPSEIQERLRPFESMFNGEVLGQKKLIREFSSGNKRKIGIAAALMAQPKVLLLDEPFANLDPSSQIKLVNILREISAQKTMTILISSHDLSHITTVCDRIALIEKGRIINDTMTTEGTLRELQHYFGA